MFVWENGLRRRAGRFGICVAACLASAPALAVGPFNINIVVNGDAESGPGATNDSTTVPIPFWDQTGLFTALRYNTPTFPSNSSPGPPNRGNNMFAGGPNNSVSGATQMITLTQGWPVFDGGQARYVLTAWLGGNGGQDDTMIVTATFNDVMGESLATATINGPTAVQRNNVTGLFFRSRMGLIPAGTRSINIALFSTRRFLPYNDGYADDISLVLINPCTADFDLDAGVTIDDLLAYLQAFEDGVIDADVDDGQGTGNPDGGVTVDDLLYFLFRFENGC